MEVLQNKNGYIILNNSIEEICRMEYDDVEESENRANAHVLASAPELLEALKNVASFIKDVAGQNATRGRLWNQVEQAIAKAEGKE